MMRGGGGGFNQMFLELCFSVTLQDEKGGFQSNAPAAWHLYAVLRRCMMRGKKFLNCSFGSGGQEVLNRSF